MVVKGSDEVKPETETASSMAIGFFENPKDFKLTNDVFGKDTLFGQGAVVSLLLVSKNLSPPTLVGRAAV